jgi:hypothetical protein
MSRSFPSSRGAGCVCGILLAEQQINIEFCVKTGKSASDALAPLTVACDEYTMKKWSVLEWHRRFKEGREDAR